MATDNRTDQLFPDVTEHYGNDLLVSNDVDFPVPQENYDDNSADDYGADSDVILPIMQVTTTAPSVDAHGEVHDAPTEELPTVHPADDIYTDAADDVEDDVVNAADPLAHAPDWVHAHIPRHPLVMEDQSRKRKSARLPRRAARPADESADSPPAETVAAPGPKVRKVREPKPPKVRASSEERNPWIMRGAAAAAVAVVVGLAATALGSSDDPQTPSATGASATAGPVAVTTAAKPSWCESSSAGGKVVGRGAGDPSNGVGLIQAFDYAYYVLRDGAKVASMMLTPNPVATIQSSINEAAAIGTEHCLTIAPTPNPNVFDVGLLLRTESDSEGSVPQRITLANSGSGLKIATIEEIR